MSSIERAWPDSPQDVATAQTSVPLVAPAPIDTERLAVRLVDDSDLPALMEVNSSEEVTALLPYATWRSAADAEAWLRRMRVIEATGLAFHGAQVLWTGNRYMSFVPVRGGKRAS